MVLAMGQKCGEQKEDKMIEKRQLKGGGGGLNERVG